MLLMAPTIYRMSAGTSMDVNGRQSMAVNGRQWTAIDVNGRRWMAIDVNGCQWTAIDVNGMGSSKEQGLKLPTWKDEFAFLFPEGGSSKAGKGETCYLRSI